MIAHRGASGHRPENTMPAYALAVDLGADMIEIDLHCTRDGTVVVTHDAALAGLGGRGVIAESSLAEVRALDAGGGEPVPTLDEVLDRFGGRIGFNLELKRGEAGEYPGLEAAALEAVLARGLLDEILFSSFYDGVLERLRQLSPQAHIGCLVSPRHAERPLARAGAVGAESLNPWHAMVTPDLVAEAHGEGLAVYPYTVDEPEAMRRLLGMGVDGLFTNFPDRMLAVMEITGSKSTRTE